MIRFLPSRHRVAEHHQQQQSLPHTLLLFRHLVTQHQQHYQQNCQHQHLEVGVS